MHEARIKGKRAVGAEAALARYAKSIGARVTKKTELSIFDLLADDRLIRQSVDKGSSVMVIHSAWAYTVHNV
jgi:hypothetical protein